MTTKPTPGEVARAAFYECDCDLSAELSACFVGGCTLAQAVQWAEARTLLGRFARSVETCWTGRIEGVTSYNDEVMLRMRGLTTTIKFATELIKAHGPQVLENYLSADDVQWFSPNDVVVYVK